MSFFITSAMALWRVDLVGKLLVSDSTNAAVQRDGERARTAIDITGAGGNVTDGILTVYVQNVGSTSIPETDLPNMDLIVKYDLSARDPLAFNYTQSDPPGAGEWTKISISGLFETAIWNPGETLGIRAALVGGGCDPGTLTTSTPSGVTDTAAFSCDGPPPASGRDWYLHSETSSIGGTSYYQLKDQTPADGAALTISSVFSPGQTGRVSPTSNNGKFVFPLAGVSQLPATTWTVTYRVKRDKPDMGFVWLDPAVDISLTPIDSWKNINLSAYVPNGATGAVVEVVKTDITGDHTGVVRAKEDTRDYMSSPSFQEIEAGTHRWQIVKLDNTRSIQGHISNTSVDFKLLGHTTGSDPAYVIASTVTPDITPSVKGVWMTIDVRTFVSDDATGAILFIDSEDGSDREYAIREVSSNYTNPGRELEEYGNSMYLVGLNDAKHFEGYIDPLGLMKIYLVGYTEQSAFYYMLDNAVPDPGCPLTCNYGNWQMMDADDLHVFPDANGLIFYIENTDASADDKDYRLSFRPMGSGDDWGVGDIGNDTHLQGAVGLDANQQWQAWMEDAFMDVYLAGYTRLVKTDIHADIDVVVRQANGVIRSTLATNVADGANITGTNWQTFTVSYAFPGYTVVDPTDYLEIDLFAEATTNISKESVSVDFRIDDLSLAVADQMRVKEP